MNIKQQVFAKWSYRNVWDIPQQPQITFGKLREFYVHWDLWANMGMTAIHWDARVLHSCHVVAAPPPLLTASPTNPHTLLCLCWGGCVRLKLWPWISKLGDGVALYVFFCCSDMGLLALLCTNTELMSKWYARKWPSGKPSKEVKDFTQDSLCLWPVVMTSLSWF